MSKIEVNAVEPQCGTTLTLGASGDTVTLGSGASQSGFGRTGAVNWQTTPKTATFTAADGEGYFINQSSAITANLPAGSAGAIVAFSDYARNFGTYNLTIAANGSEKIGGIAADAKLNVDGQAATFVYVDSTQGWVNVQNAEDTETGKGFVTATGGTITTSGNCKIHTFTGPGTFTVSCAGIPANAEVSYLVVAGGGGGGVKRAGGGGAGGFREYKAPTTPYTASPLDGNPGGTSITVTAQAYPITVGGGGSSGTGSTPICTTASPVNTQGSTSTFSTVSSAGGGAGGGTGTPTGAGGDGGSGGGGVHAMTGRPSPAANAAGSGNTPSVTPAQGNNGGSTGSFPQPPATVYHSAGGGGAGGVGQNSQPGPRAGGPGVATNITGSPVTYAAGGNGGTYAGAGTPISNAPDNSGNGGAGKSTGPGGNPSSAGANGGSGIVVIRYKFQ